MEASFANPTPPSGLIHSPFHTLSPKNASSMALIQSPATPLPTQFFTHLHLAAPASTVCSPGTTTCLMAYLWQLWPVQGSCAGWRCDLDDALRWYGCWGGKKFCPKVELLHFFLPKRCVHWTHLWNFQTFFTTPANIYFWHHQHSCQSPNVQTQKVKAKEKNSS